MTHPRDYDVVVWPPDGGGGDVPSLKEAYVYNGGVKVDELENEYFINELVLELRLRAVHLWK